MRKNNSKDWRTLPNEIWEDVRGYEGLYKVSSMGKVKSLKWGKERILRPEKNNKGYLRVTLCKDGKNKRFYVHRLVAEAFIPNPNNLPCINHKDENPLNCNVENLEWCTQKENVNYGTRNERDAKTKSKPVVGIDSNTGEVVVEFPSAMEAGRNGYNQGNISECCLGKKKTAYGLIWQYK